MRVLNRIDDYSRLRLDSHTQRTFKGPDVDRRFRKTAARHGNPASLLSDNAAVFAGAPRRHGRIPPDAQEVARPPASGRRTATTGSTPPALSTLRHNSRLHHIGVRSRHAGTRILVLAHDLDIRVLTADGELLRELVLDPGRDSQPQPNT